MRLPYILNALLFIKQKIDKGEDVSHAIDSALNQSEHPYVVYLKSLNEAQQGRHESSIYWANLFLSTIEANSYYFQVYGNLIGQAKMTADPNYALDKDGELSIVEELSLGDCKLHEARPFGLMITNKGQSPLFIHDIVLGCTCVEFSNEKKQYTLQPMQSQTIDFVFKADVQGEIFREIMFFSNGINPVERVQITATVK